MYFTPSEVVLALQSAQPASKRPPSGTKGSIGLASVAISDEGAEATPATSIVRLQFIASDPNTVMSIGTTQSALLRCLSDYR